MSYNTLEDYMSIEDKKERLCQFYRDCVESQEDYINSEDYVNSYYELVELYDIFLGDIQNDKLKERLKNLTEDEIGFLLDKDIIKADVFHDIVRRDSELFSYNIDEIEVQLLNIVDSQTNCIYSELVKGFSVEEIKKINNSFDDAYIVSGYIYIDYSYSRVSFVIDEEKAIEFFKL